MKKMHYSGIALALTLCMLMSTLVIAEGNDEPVSAIAQDAQQYLTYIGTNLKNRSAVFAKTKADKDNTHEKTIEWIIGELKNTGISSDQIQLQEFEKTLDSGIYACTNIVVILKGKSDAKQVIVGAHYDGVGCGDNGSGIAFLLAEIKGLYQAELPYQIMFVFFDAEEAGELGSEYYVENMSQSDINKTLFMVNIDSIAFGDYCNLYGGVQDDSLQTVKYTQAYEHAMEKAKEQGIITYQTADLDSYYDEHKTGPKIDTNAVYTNPWTYEHPSPADEGSVPTYASPSTGYWGDHIAFEEAGIQYIYFEATNWYAKGDGGNDAYTDYFDTDNRTIGKDGMFMNTEYDTLDSLNTYFPGRALQHFSLYSTILTKVLQEPES